MLTLRPYQQDAVDAVYRYLRDHDDNPVVVIPTAGGKTPILATICRDAVQKWNGRVLVIAHVKELLQQSADKLRLVCPDVKFGIYSAGLKRRDTDQAVIVAGIQSIYKRACELDAFDLVIIDECVPEGTLIATPTGPVPIELIRASDSVLNATGTGQVLATSARPASDLVNLEFSDGTTLTCTSRHPIFTDQGWVNAGTLELGAVAYGIEDVRALWEGVPTLEQDAVQRTDPGYEGASLEKATFLLKILLQEAQQPNVAACGATEGQQTTPRDWTSTGDARGKWLPARNFSTGASQCAGVFVGSGVGGSNAQTPEGRLANSLQDRLGKPGADGSNRNRWPLPRFPRAQITGSSQDQISCGKRVEGVTHHQCTSPRVVYNLHVSGHPSYFANGVLVHNCHMIPPEGEGMYRQFLAEAQVVNPHLRVIGLTATPYRLKSGLICSPDNFLNAVCYEVGVRELIVGGYLCPLVTKSGSAKADTQSLHIRGGEFIAGEVEDLMDSEELVEAACDEIVERTRDRNSVLIFASGIRHGRHVQRILSEKHEIECGFVSGETPSAERDELLARFRGQADGLFDRKPLKYLCNINVLTTGFDAPNIDCVAMLRPTLSPGLYYQMVGRGFRLHPGKQNCLVLDYGGNVLRHGPVDQIRIKDRPGDGSGVAPAKECPECHSLIAAGYATCPDCGFVFPPPDRNQHDAKASNAGILSGEVTDTEFEVLDVFYSVHRKRDAPEEAPKTMRVEYQLGMSYLVSEWICFEHTGYARRKAEKWWKERSPDPVPDTAERAVQLAEAGALAPTESVVVRSIVGEPFDRIIRYTLGAMPEPVAYNFEPYDDEVPF